MYTLEIGYPWVTFGAIIALEAIVNKEMRVLEFGCGGSTIFWARNCKSVKSYESNPEWYRDVSQKTANMENVEIILCREHMGITLKTEPDSYYDLVFVDSDPKAARRSTLARLAVSKIKPGGWLVVDNYLKFGMGDFDYSKFYVYSFDEFHFAGQGTRICRKIA
jgi:predicted O-methyltransferase YrrM